MTETSNNKFKIADRSVKGAIRAREESTVEQIDSAEFLRRIDAILALPRVTAVVWDQYTPYFNDGEPCEFSVNEPRIVFDFEGLDPDDEEQEGLFGEDSYRDHSEGFTSDDLWEKRDGFNYNQVWVGDRWDGTGTLNREAVTFVGRDGIDFEPYWEALHTLDRADWESVARANFGDHAEVRATTSGFEVEFYEHD